MIVGSEKLTARDNLEDIMIAVDIVQRNRDPRGYDEENCRRDV
jgi:hypothetical protein